MAKSKEKSCPLLDGLGIADTDSQGGKTICQYCPLWDKKVWDKELQNRYCVFDKWDNGEDVSQEDWNKLVELRGKIWGLLKGVSNAE